MGVSCHYLKWTDFTFKQIFLGFSWDARNSDGTGLAFPPANKCLEWSKEPPLEGLCLSLATRLTVPYYFTSGLFICLLGLSFCLCNKKKKLNWFQKVYLEVWYLCVSTIDFSRPLIPWVLCIKLCIIVHMWLSGIVSSNFSKECISEKNQEPWD